MIALSFLGWAAGWFLFAGLRRCAARPNDDVTPADISVIIPSRDEERNLPALLRSIATQPIAPREVIVVDDCSRDETSTVAKKHGARVVTGVAPPRHWLGKSWACQQGADAASGEVLLFLDADTWLERGGLSALARELGSCTLSVAPYHDVPTYREQFSAFFNLVMFAGVGPKNLLGQCLLIRRAVYQAIGGHRAVKDQVVENFALGQKLRGSVSLKLGRGVLSMRMYPGGWREMTEGWSKSFVAGAGRTSLPRLALIILWMTGSVVAVMNPVSYVLFVLQLAILLYRIGSYRLLTALLYPLPLFYFLAVFALSILRTRGGQGFLWKGRRVRAA